MAANACRAYLLADDPWYSVSCSLKQGHAGPHAHKWTEDNDNHRMRARKKQERVE